MTQTAAVSASTETHPAPVPASEDKAWSREAILALFDLPLMELIGKAQDVHRQHWDPNVVQTSALLSVKTGGCSENCGYCSQSASFETGTEASKLMSLDDVRVAAERAKASGATRFCMSAAWRSLKERDMVKVLELVEGVKALGLETCMTLGMIDEAQAAELKDAGLDYYNHNVDTSEEYYDKVVTTRTYDDRLKTLKNVRNAGLKICSGGIVGMGEARDDRAGMLETLANLDPQPESVPINMLVPIPGTPMEGMAPFDPFELVRTVAVARLLMPKSYVRLSAGRRELSDEAQALCFLAGANSLFSGDRLLTTDNPEPDADDALFARLGITLESRIEASAELS